MSSAGWTWNFGMAGSVPEGERDGDEVSRRDGKRACMICIVRTADIMVVEVSEVDVYVGSQFKRRSRE
jgi:hypothetical protein